MIQSYARGVALRYGRLLNKDIMVNSFIQSVIQKDKDIIIPIDINKTVQYDNDCFVRVLSIEQGRYFHKVYITIVDGKVHSNKLIKVLNTNIFEFGGTVFIKGNSIKNDLVNGQEIL